MNIAVFACDPGGATGLAWGVFDPKADFEDALANRMLAGSTTVSGKAAEQIPAIAQLWSDFYSASVREALLPPDRVFPVMEDFLYAPGVNYEGESAKISTAIIWGFEGYRMGRAFEWRQHKRGTMHIPGLHLQTAGQAKGFATNQRLKDWGIWVVGREHERSAWQHVAYFLKRYKQQHP